jgi:hypothetical protein
VADRTITLDLIGRDRSMSTAMDKAGDAADKNGAKFEKFGQDMDDAATSADKTSKKYDAYGKKLEGVAKDTDKVGRSTQSNSSKIEKFGSDLDKVQKEAADVAEGIGDASLKFQKFTGAIGLGSLLLVHASIAGHALAVAAAALSGSLGLIPGIAAGGAATLGTLKLAFTGVGTAITEADPKAYAKELKALSPATKDTVVAVRAQRSAFEDLRKSVQQSFFASMASQIRPLVKTFMPALTSSLDLISAQFGAATVDTLEWIRSTEGVKDVKNILSNVTGLTGGLGAAFLHLAPAIVRVVSVSSDFLPRIGKLISGASKDVADFLTKVTTGGKSSPFAHWIDSAFTEFGKLKRGFQDVVKVFQNKTVQTDAKQIFGAIEDAAKKVQWDLPLVIKALQSLEPALVNIIKNGGASFGSSLHTYAHAAILLAPAINKVTAAIGPLAPFMGQVAAVAFLAGNGIRILSFTLAVLRPALLLARAAWVVLDFAMDANPIGLVVAAIVILIGVVVLLTLKSKSFRDAMVIAFQVVSTIVIANIELVLDAFGALFSVLGHLPGKAGAPFRAMSGFISGVKGKLNDLQDRINSLHGKNVNINVTTTMKTVVDSTYNGNNYSGDDKIHAPGKAAGGPVRAGQMYIVGEKRPELFVPRQSGTIIPQVPRTGTGSAVGGLTVQVYVTQPLATPGAIADAVVDSFAKRAPGAKKLPASAVTGR